MKSGYSLIGHFYENRAYIENEYEEADWSGGLETAEIERLMRSHLENNKHRPYPVALMEALSILLENAKLDLNPRTMFPDKICHGATYKNAASGGIFEKITVERYARVFESRCPAAWRQRALSAILGIAIPDTDVWHALSDWDAVIGIGVPGLLLRAENEKKRHEDAGTLDEDKITFYDSVIIAYRALIRYMERLLALSREKGLSDYAACLEPLLKGAPKTLYQAMALQHIFLTVSELGHERIRAYGPVDRMWLPFYISDIKNGVMTKEEIKEMLRYFLEKISAEKRSADQPLCLGTAYGEDGSEGAELIFMLLEAYEELGNHNPKLHIRCPARLSDKLLRKLMEMIRKGNSSIVLINDETVIKAYSRIGVKRELADKYVPLGCYESAIMGYEDARICGSWINLAKGAEYAVHGGFDHLGGVLFGMTSNPNPASWEEFLSIYYGYLKFFADFVKNNLDRQSPHTYAANPSPILSGTVRSCMERGRDVYDRGMEMCNQSIKCFAIGTAVDSLLSVKKFVYGTGELTLPELSEILKNNWQGAEKLRLRVMREPVKWGNDIEEADRLAADIFNFMADNIIGVPTYNGGVFRMGADSVDMAERYGRFTGATPDGRLAHTPLSKNMRPVIGMERNGVTAFIKSATAVDGSLFVDGAPVDIMLHPSAVSGEDGLLDMMILVKTFMERGGMCIHGNVVSAKTLREAQEHPEKYPRLQVRVCGWNEYFVRMNKAFQEDFIRRSESLEN